MKKKKVFKNDFIHYTIFMILFLLVGVLQYFDSLVSTYWCLFFHIITEILIFSIIIGWGISLRERIVDKHLRINLITIAMLLLFYMVMRFIKYRFTNDGDDLNIYLWYAYYIPHLLIPCIIFLSTLNIDRKYNKLLDKKWYIVYIPSLILIGAVFTNDFHQEVFRFDYGRYSYSKAYTHQTLYFIIVAWIVLLIISSIIVLFYKCRISAARKKIWIPLGLTIFFGFLLVLSSIFEFEAFKLPETICFITIVLIECLIYIGLIPTNSDYNAFFKICNLNACITDKNLDVCYASLKSENTFNNEILKELLEKGELTILDNKYQKQDINAGYCFIVEDIKEINTLNKDIKEVCEELKGANDLVNAENKLREDEASIETKNALLYELVILYKERFDKINALLVEAKTLNESNTNKELVVKNLRLCSFYLSFIKRRCNLLLINKNEEKIPLKELVLCLKESLKYLSLLGVTSSIDIPIFDDSLAYEEVVLLYDFFEDTIEKVIDGISAIMVTFKKQNDNLIFRLYINSSNFDIDTLLNYDKYNDIDKEINLIKEDLDTFYLTLTLKGGLK